MTSQQLSRETCKTNEIRILWEGNWNLRTESKIHNCTKHIGSPCNNFRNQSAKRMKLDPNGCCYYDYTYISFFTAPPTGSTRRDVMFTAPGLRLILWHIIRIIIRVTCCHLPHLCIAHSEVFAHICKGDHAMLNCISHTPHPVLTVADDLAKLSVRQCRLVDARSLLKNIWWGTVKNN